MPLVGELPIYIDYHDKEWGKPQFDSQKLFEKNLFRRATSGAFLDHRIEKNAKPIEQPSINLTQPKSSK